MREPKIDPVSGHAMRTHASVDFELSDGDVVCPGCEGDGRQWVGPHVVTHEDGSTRHSMGRFADIDACVACTKDEHCDKHRCKTCDGSGYCAEPDPTPNCQWQVTDGESGADRLSRQMEEARKLK